LAKSKLSIGGRFSQPRFSFLQKTARTEMGFRWLADLSIFEQQNGLKETRQHKKLKFIRRWEGGFEGSSQSSGYRTGLALG
jgi:hypothetical protein